MGYQGLYQGGYQGGYQGPIGSGVAPPSPISRYTDGTVAVLTPSLVAGDLEPDLRLQLLADGAPRDLTAVASVAMRWRKPTGEVQLRDLDIEDAVQGLVSYTWAVGDTDNPGFHKLQVVLTFDSGEHTTYPTDGSAALWNVGEVLS